MSDLPTPENITCPSCGAAQLPGPFCTNCGALLQPPAPSDQPGTPRPTGGAMSGAPPPPQPPAPFETPTGPGGGYSFGGPPQPPYPVALEFNGPLELSRLSTLFRLILAIPLFIFLAVLGWFGGGVLFALVVAHWLSLLVRKGRPVGWIGSAIVALIRFYFRANAYLLLLTDKYPAFEGEWLLTLEMQRPERISRRQIFFWKTLALIPHFICLAVLSIAVVFTEVIAWFAIVFTGRYPSGLRDFVIGFMRWTARVMAYWFSLRDEFPPYTLSADGSAGSRSATGFSALGGAVAAVLIGVGITAAYLAATDPVTTHVSYAQITSGRESPAIIVDNIEVQITKANDDYNFPGGLLVPEDDTRFVMIETGIFNGRVADIDVVLADFELRDDSGDKNDPIFASVNGTAREAELVSGAYSFVTLVFEVDESAEPTEFRYGPDRSLRDAQFIFD